MIRRLAILSLVALACVCTSCSMFNSACADALPYLTAGQALEDDAQSARDQAADIVTQIANPDLRAKAIAALAVVDSSLRAAAASMHAASTACSKPDVTAVFADFVAAWRALQPFIALLGGPSAGSQVADPIVVGMAR